MKPLLIVDGYNVIGCWAEAERQMWPLDVCRDKLLHLLQDYSGYSGEEIVLVFDGYQSDKQTTTEENWAGIRLVYTRHGETADSYIERLAAQVPRYRQVRVATSDGLEQSQALSTGAVRMTSRELLRELQQIRRQGYAGHNATGTVQKSNLESRLPENTRQLLEQLRRGDAEEPAPPTGSAQGTGRKPKRARGPREGHLQG